MSIKSFLSKIVAKRIVNQTEKWSGNPVQTQNKIFKELIQSAKNTAFGKDHNFDQITSYEEFAKTFPFEITKQ